MAFAVFKLMTSSNLVGCSTGKSAGFPGNVPAIVARRQTVACREGDHLRPLRADQRLGHHQESIRTDAADPGNCVRKVLNPGDLTDSDAQIEPARGFRCVSDIPACAGVGWIIRFVSSKGNWSKRVLEVHSSTASRLQRTGTSSARCRNEFRI